MLLFFFFLQLDLMGNCTGGQIIQFQGKSYLKKFPANSKSSFWGCSFLVWVSTCICHASPPPDEVRLTVWLSVIWLQSWSL